MIDTASKISQQATISVRVHWRIPCGFGGWSMEEKLCPHIRISMAIPEMMAPAIQVIVSRAIGMPVESPPKRDNQIASVERHNTKW